MDVRSASLCRKQGGRIVVPVWELSRDLAKQTFFPNRWMDGGKELTNLMVVAPSDKNGNPSMNSNYGAKELDLFAPGMNIYSAYMGDTYKTGTGVGLAAASVAGVAALIKAYYPNLTGAQIRNILLENVTSRKAWKWKKVLSWTANKLRICSFLKIYVCLVVF